MNGNFRKSFPSISVKYEMPEVYKYSVFPVIGYKNIKNVSSIRDYIDDFIKDTNIIGSVEDSLLGISREKGITVVDGGNLVFSNWTGGVLLNSSVSLSSLHATTIFVNCVVNSHNLLVQKDDSIYCIFENCTIRNSSINFRSGLSVFYKCLISNSTIKTTEPNILKIENSVSIGSVFAGEHKFSNTIEIEDNKESTKLIKSRFSNCAIFKLVLEFCILSNSTLDSSTVYSSILKGVVLDNNSSIKYSKLTNCTSKNSTLMSSIWYSGKFNGDFCYDVTWINGCWIKGGWAGGKIRRIDWKSGVFPVYVYPNIGSGYKKYLVKSSISPLKLIELFGRYTATPKLEKYIILVGISENDFLEKINKLNKISKIKIVNNNGDVLPEGN